MAEQPFNAANNPPLPAPQPTRRDEDVLKLERLLELLYPGPPSIDCITIDNVLYRYRLTGLRAPALTAIEQSQRIVRARGDHSQTGLCEFHIGLIYFQWSDYRAAAGQFAVARQPWALAGDHSANCLAHFAQGLALARAHHHEPAMTQFGRAERLLDRALHGAGSGRHAAMADLMRPWLTAAQEASREALWPKDQAPGVAGQAGPPPPSAGSASGQAPSPDNLLEPFYGPIPGHTATDERFGWYVIVSRRSRFLPNIAPGLMLLADRDVDAQPAQGSHFVVVGSTREGLGDIIARPISHVSVLPYCYIGYRSLGANGGVEVVINDSWQPLGGSDLLVLAVVKGVWYVLDGQGGGPGPAGG